MFSLTKEVFSSERVSFKSMLRISRSSGRMAAIQTGIPAQILQESTQTNRTICFDKVERM